MQDKLIRADDVLRHYEALKKHDSRLASVKVFDGLGHCDFNYRHHDAVAVALQQALSNKVDDKDERTDVSGSDLE
jgi:hypothetical protein